MAYTYLIRHIPTNTFYYGVKYGKQSDPTDFWVRYFTSSKKVSALIDEYGKESFVYEIRKTFDTAESAIRWEKTVLRRMKVHLREDFININPGRGYGYAIGEKHYAYGTKYNEERKRSNKIGQRQAPAWRNTPKDHKSRRKLAELARKRFAGKKQTKEHIQKRKLMGEKNPMFGKTHSAAEKTKLSECMKAKASAEDWVGRQNLCNSVKERMSKGTHPSQIKTNCQHCGKEIASLGNYKRWHGENCKSKVLP